MGLLDDEFPALRRLDISFSELSSLEGLSRLARLRELSAYSCRLEDVDEVGSARYLVTLMLQQNSIRQIPPGFRALTRLKELRLDRNLLTDIGDNLCFCSALRLLDISCNKIASLEGVAGLHSLRELRANSNLITSLRPLKALPSLRELQVSHNRLTTLDGIQVLLMLETVVADHNMIETLRIPFTPRYVQPLRKALPPAEPSVLSRPAFASSNFGSSTKIALVPAGARAVRRPMSASPCPQRSLQGQGRQCQDKVMWTKSQLRPLSANVVGSGASRPLSSPLSQQRAYKSLKNPMRSTCETTTAATTASSVTARWSQLMPDQSQGQRPGLERGQNQEQEQEREGGPLRSLFALTRLELHHNRISSLNGLELLGCGLEHLDLSHNLIRDRGRGSGRGSPSYGGCEYLIGPLSRLSRLAELKLQGNPFLCRDGAAIASINKATAGTSATAIATASTGASGGLVKDDGLIASSSGCYGRTVAATLASSLRAACPLLWLIDDYEVELEEEEEENEEEEIEEIEALDIIGWAAADESKRDEDRGLRTRNSDNNNKTTAKYSSKKIRDILKVPKIFFTTSVEEVEQQLRDEEVRRLRMKRRAEQEEEVQEEGKEEEEEVLPSGTEVLTLVDTSTNDGGRVDVDVDVDVGVDDVVAIAQPACDGGAAESNHAEDVAATATATATALGLNTPASSRTRAISSRKNNNNAISMSLSSPSSSSLSQIASPYLCFEDTLTEAEISLMEGQAARVLTDSRGALTALLGLRDRCTTEEVAEALAAIDRDRERLERDRHGYGGLGGSTRARCTLRELVGVYRRRQQNDTATDATAAAAERTQPTQLAATIATTASSRREATATSNDSDPGTDEGRGGSKDSNKGSTDNKRERNYVEIDDRTESIPNGTTSAPVDLLPRDLQ